MSTNITVTTGKAWKPGQSTIVLATGQGANLFGVGLPVQAQIGSRSITIIQVVGDTLGVSSVAGSSTSFAPGTVITIPVAATGGGGAGNPGGSSGQFQINAAGSFGGVTVSGDGTVNSSGVLSVAKTGGVAFAPSATTDATNAANITSGTLPIARIAATTITYAKLQNVAPVSLLGNPTGSPAATSEIALAGGGAALSGGNIQINTPTVATHSARNSIADALRTPGMLVFTQNDSVYWAWNGGTAGTDADWSQAGPMQFSLGGSVESNRGALNFIQGSNVTLTVADNSGADRCDVTIAATGGGGGSSDWPSIPLIGDSFRGTSATVLTAHTADSGATWPSDSDHQAGGTAGATDIQLDGTGGLFLANADSANIPSTAMPTVPFEVIFGLDRLTALAGAQIASLTLFAQFTGGFDTAAGMVFNAQEPGGSNPGIFFGIGGTPAGSVAASPAVGTPILIKIRVTVSGSNTVFQASSSPVVDSTTSPAWTDLGISATVATSALTKPVNIGPYSQNGTGSGGWTASTGPHLRGPFIIRALG